MNIGIVLCNDDSDELESEEKMIRSILEEKSVKYELKAFRSPLELLTENTVYDMAFFDIEMKEINGIDLARKILERKNDCCIFFLTNYLVYLDKAMDISALRYLIKPIDTARLESGIDTALERINEKEKKIEITNIKSRRSVRIAISDILLIATSGRHVHITTKQGGIDVRENFSVIKDLIENEVSYFAVPHRGYFVNMKYVTDYNRNKVTIAYAGNEYMAYVSRRRYDEFDERMLCMTNNL